MPNVIKIANPGINALTNTGPENFSLYVDGSEDHVLVKEKTRGTQEVDAGDFKTVSHDLGYIPNCIGMAEVSSGEFEYLKGNFIYDVYSFYVNDADLILINNEAIDPKIFAYFIFYDQI
jgi:hypothetical protein